MQIRNPFKDYFGNWKDNITIKEKVVWSVIIVSIGMTIESFIFN